MPWSASLDIQAHLVNSSQQSQGSEPDHYLHTSRGSGHSLMSQGLQEGQGLQRFQCCPASSTLSYINDARLLRGSDAHLMESISHRSMDVSKCPPS